MSSHKRKFDTYSHHNHNQSYNQNHNRNYSQKKQRPENGSSFHGGHSQDHKLPPLPPLPPISPEHAKAVFTHPSISAKFDQNYERLEFMGDAHIELIASTVIFERYTDATPGKMSALREKLVNNATLSRFSRGYGFDKKLRIAKGDVQPTDWTKIQGDLLEAYVAAVILSDIDKDSGFEAATRWLTELWQPMFKEFGLKIMEANDIQSKETLARSVLIKGANLEYIRVDNATVNNGDGTSTFTVEAYYTGLGYEKVFLGRGKGISKNAAGQAAAKDALSSILLQEIKAKRQKFLDEKAEKEKQDAQVKEEGVKDEKKIE